MTEPVERQNTKLGLKLALIAIAMFGFGYGLVPFYDVICKYTGFGGKTNTSAVQEVAYQVNKSREVTVEFLTTVNETTPLEFHAETNKVKVHPGEYKTVNFYAENKTDKKLLVRAIDSVSPSATKFYFEKAKCFCFSQQTFNPHEKKTLPVRFVVKPDLPAEYNTISLSYTFFDNTDMQ